MCTSSTKEVAISVLLALQLMTTVVAQELGYSDNNLCVWDVTSKVDDYVLENRRQYNATLQRYFDGINVLKNSLEGQLIVLEKQKVLLLQTIQESNERVAPFEVLSLPTKYCVQKYRLGLPYANIIKENIESCITSARNNSNIIVSAPIHYYNVLNNYYNTNFKNGIEACLKAHQNPSLDYRLCVTKVISETNAYTINSRQDFATSIEISQCSLSSLIDVAVRCTYTQFNSVLTSLGATNRLIDNCINAVFEDKPCCLNKPKVISYGCPHVVYMEVKDDADVEGKMLSTYNALEKISRNQTCLEIKFL